MKKIFKQLIALCRDEKIELKIRLFRIILILGELGCLLSTIVNLVLQSGKLVSGCTALGCVLFALIFFFTTRIKDCSNLYMALLLFTNCLLFPFSFISSGGIQSGAPAWLIFGLAFTFMLLRGWRMFLTLGCSVVSLIWIYIFALLDPDKVNNAGSASMAVYSSCTSVIICGVVIGCIFYLETYTYDRARRHDEEQRKTIQRLSDARNLFFANMSHEIRTPINTIIGLNEMTLREDISPEVKENSVNIESASKILLALINDILDLSKIESGKMSIVPVQYEMSSMLSDLVNIIWARANAKGLAFHVDVDKDLPSELYGDEMRIKQVIVNLLSNAVKYTEKGSVELAISSERTDVNQIMLKMSVRDTGIGIKSENIEKLFSTFGRVDEAKNRGIEGTGLGLSIAKQLVDMMDGTISVDSIYTKGSVFTVTIPQKIINDSPIGTVRSSALGKGDKRPEYSRSFEAPEARVLIVDDNEMNLMVVRKLLRETRVQTDTAASGEECLQKTLEKSYNVIFMDHLMPGMDGEMTLKALRSRPEGFCQDTPVIALTANVMANASDVYGAMGFDAYLSKPINSAALEATLQKFLPAELITYTSSAEGGEIGDRLSAMMVHGKKKERLRITTDSVCDLPSELIDEYNIKVMHYYVATHEGHFKDELEISSENMLEYIARGNEAKSEPGSVQEYEEFFADNLIEAEQIIHISMTSNASRGFETASQAANGFHNVTVLDSGNLSSGLGMLVLGAARMARDGAGPQEIEEHINRIKDKVSTSFILATPENLYVNGRMGRNSYILGSVLHLHHVLRINRGRITLMHIYAGKMTTCAKKYIRSRLRGYRKIDDDTLFITYSGCTMAQLEEIRSEVENYMHFKHVYLQQATSAIASNCGIGAFGLIYMKQI